VSRETAGLIAATIAPRGTAWHGGPTPVGALRGVTARQAHWAPAPGRHSIWALALHLAYWNYAIRRHLTAGDIPRFPRAPANWPRVPATPDDRAWQADRRLLAQEHALLAEAIRRFRGSLNRRPRTAKRWTFGEMIIGALAHDAYHTGQIQMLKRLWRGVRRET
jgi:hypothetical protein